MKRSANKGLIGRLDYGWGRLLPGLSPPVSAPAAGLAGAPEPPLRCGTRTGKPVVRRGRKARGLPAGGSPAAEGARKTMRYRPIQAALRERVPFTLWGPSRMRTFLAALAASAAALVPAVMIASPAQAAPSDFL